MKAVTPSVLRQGVAVLVAKLLLIVAVSLIISQVHAAWWAAVLLGGVVFLNFFGISAIQRRDARESLIGVALVFPVASVVALLLFWAGPEGWFSTLLYWLFQVVIAALMLHWFWQFRVYWSMVQSMRDN